MLYNGSNGRTYNTIDLTSTSLTNIINGFGFIELSLPTNGIQNGGPDGLALIDASGNVIQFLSYEGTFQATNGPASGETSVDIGVSETGSTAVGTSLQLQGNGSTYTDFTWASSTNETFGSANNLQTFIDSDVVFINELQVSTTGADWDFFELQGLAGKDLSDLTFLVIKSDNSPTSRGTIDQAISLSGQSIPADGFWVAADANAITTYDITPDLSISSNTFENSSSTYLLVSGFSGSQGTDLDTDDDGTLDLTPWTEIIDSVAILDSRASDTAYAGATALGPDGSFFPSGIFRSPDAPTGNFSTSFLSFSTADGTPGTSNGEGSTSDNLTIEGNSNTITNGDTTPSTTDGTDFGNSISGSEDSATFTIKNDTGGSISVTTISITGTNASDFSISSSTASRPFSIADDANQDFIIELSDTATIESKSATITVVTDTTTITFAIAANVTTIPSMTFIHSIQGDSSTSPLDGQTVTIEGIVVGDFQDGSGTNGDINGFFIQEEDGDIDVDNNTSEGIFVFDGSSPAVDVTNGDKVQVTGTVDEFFGFTQIVSISNITLISSGNTLPTAAIINLPATSSTTNSDGDVIANLENVEGMLVNLPQEMTVTEMFNLDRFGEFRISQGGRLRQFTQENLPSVSGYNAHLDAIAKRSITIDDGLSIQNPDPIIFPDGNLNSSDAFRMGNTITGLTGVISYSRSSGSIGIETYRLLPTTSFSVVNTNPRQNTPSDVGGSLKVVSFNVLNYFTTLDEGSNATAIGEDPRGADNAAEFGRQRQKLLEALLDINADVYGLIELENDFSPTSNGNAIKDIVDGLNATVGSGTFDWVDPGTQFVGDDTIAVGVIYKTSTVSISNGTTVEILDDSDLSGLGFTSSPAVFNGNSTNRAPIAVTFTETSSGEKFTVVVLHFKSKGSAGTASSGDSDTGDGAGNANQTRLNGSTVLASWLDTDPTNSGDNDFLVLGDFNAYAKETPITFFEGEGYTDLARNAIGNSAYSFVFDGQTGTLDYAFANNSLLSQVSGATEWHINADEANAIDYNTDFGRSTSIFNGLSPFRSSDHDPIIVGLSLTSPTLGISNDLNSIDRRFNISPVPMKSDDTINIEVLEVSGAVTVEVFNLAGQKIWSKGFNTTEKLITSIDLSNLVKGTYLMKVTSANNTVSRIFEK